MLFYIRYIIIDIKQIKFETDVTDNQTIKAICYIYIYI